MGRLVVLRVSILFGGEKFEPVLIYYLLTVDGKEGEFTISTRSAVSEAKFLGDW